MGLPAPRWMALLVVGLSFFVVVAHAAPAMMDGDFNAGSDGDQILLQEGKAKAKVDCVVGEWGAPGPCSAKCGGGLRSYRRVVSTPPSGQGRKCPGLIKATKCNTQLCGKGPGELAKKKQQKVHAMKIKQKKAQKVLFAKLDKKVHTAQDRAVKALTASLKDTQVGGKKHNDAKYVELVDSVNAEIKAYHDDSKQRDAMITKQVRAKKELFEKNMVEAVHRMKRHMGRVKAFHRNPLYRNAAVEGKYSIEAAKTAVSNEKLLAKWRKKRAKKNKSKTKQKTSLGEGSPLDDAKRMLDQDVEQRRAKRQAAKNAKLTAPAPHANTHRQDLSHVHRLEQKAQARLEKRKRQRRTYSDERKLSQAEAALAQREKRKVERLQLANRAQAHTDARLHTQLHEEKAALLKEKAAKRTERLASKRVQAQQRLRLTTLEKGSKRKAAKLSSRVHALAIHLHGARKNARELNFKLAKTNALDKLKHKNRQKHDEARAKAMDKKRATINKVALAAQKQLKSARLMAYREQRNAALVAKQMATLNSVTPESVMRQKHADMEAQRAKDHLTNAVAETNAALSAMPTSIRGTADMNAIKKAGSDSKAKAKAAMKSYRADKKRCLALKKAADKTCRGMKSKRSQRKKAAVKKKAKPTKTSKKAAVKKKAKSAKTSKTAAKAGKKKATPQELMEAVGLSKKKKSSKTKLSGQTKLCLKAQKAASSACGKVSGAKNKAQVSKHVELKKLAYVARMKSARVALKEAGGKASKLDVKRADDAAAKAEKKANGVASAGGGKGKGSRYTKSQVQSLVKAQVKKALLKQNKAKGKKKKGKKKTKSGKVKKKKKKAKKVLGKVVKKAAKITQKAFKAQRAAAMMAKMAHEKMASGSDLAQADRAAATAKKAAHRMAELSAYVMECEKGKVKLVALKKQYGQAKGKALRDMLEMQISHLKVTSARACKKGIKEKKKEKKTAQKAKKEKKKMKKKLKKAENKAQKVKTAKRRAKDPTALYKPVKEHNVITARYIGPPTAAMNRKARLCKHCKRRCKTAHCLQKLCTQFCGKATPKQMKAKGLKAKPKNAKKAVAKIATPKKQKKSATKSTTEEAVTKHAKGTKAFINGLKRESSKAKALEKKASKQKDKATASKLKELKRTASKALKSLKKPPPMKKKAPVNKKATTAKKAPVASKVPAVPSKKTGAGKTRST